MPDPLLLIDGDGLLYGSTLAAEFETRWDADNHVLACNFEEAKEAFENQMRRIQEACGSKSCRIAFTGSSHSVFRIDIWPAYKASRANNRKPLAFSRLRDWACDTYPCHMVEGLEADDILGIWHTKDPKEDTIIVSDDKDMKTLPGKLYRREKGVWQLQTINPTEADHFWMMQTLTGDVTDGYPGLPGVGPARAQKILNPSTDGAFEPLTIKELWPFVVAAYEKAGLTEDDALIQARCARILRTEDWDSANKKVILWNPK
jgi:DNA polymerase-1